MEKIFPLSPGSPTKSESERERGEETESVRQPHTNEMEMKMFLLIHLLIFLFDILTEHFGTGSGWLLLDEGHRTFACSLVSFP